VTAVELVISDPSSVATPSASLLLAHAVAARAKTNSRRMSGFFMRGFPFWNGPTLTRGAKAMVRR
jgi:hypothetical protein